MSQNKTNQITVRGLPEVFLKNIKSEARRHGLSLSQVILNRLFVTPSKSREGACAGLLGLSGSWDKKTASEFDKTLSQARQIDKKMWSS